MPAACNRATDSTAPSIAVLPRQITPSRSNIKLCNPRNWVDDSGVAYQVAGGSRFFFGEKKRVATRVELSIIDEKTAPGD